MYIRFNLQIFFIILLFFFTNKIEVYSVLLVFILLHELAHIITAIILKFNIIKIKITLLGFSIFLKKEKNIFLKSDKSKIILSGPIFNILSAIVFLYVPMFDDLRILIVYSNIFLFIINLIPIFPLDGGNNNSEKIKLVKCFKYQIS